MMKKIVSFALTLVLMAAIAVPAIALKYAGMNVELSQFTITSAPFRASDRSSGRVSFEDYVVQEGEGKISIHLLREGFTLGAPNGTPLTGAITATDIKDSKMDVIVTYKKGRDLVKSVMLDKKTGCIEIIFYDSLRSVSDKDYDMTVALRIDKQTVGSISLDGTVRNDTVEINDDAQTTTLEDGRVGEVNGFNRGVEIDIGMGVTIRTRLFDGRKIRAVVSREPDEADLLAIKQHPDIDNVIRLDTIGLVNSDAKITLAMDNKDYYVYDVNWKLIGRGGDELPLSAKYYLANKKLEIVSDIVVE